MIVANVDIFADMLFTILDPTVISVTVLDFVIFRPALVLGVRVVVVVWITLVFVVTPDYGEGDKN